MITLLREQRSEAGRKFAASFKDSRKALDKLTKDGAKRVESLVRELRREIKGRMASIIPGDLNQPFLISIVPGIQAEIDAALAEYSRLANSEMIERLQSSFDTGSKVTASAFKAAGVPSTFPSISPELLQTLSANATTVLDELVSNLGVKINQQIRLAATGLEPASGAIDKISNLLKTSEEVRKGLRRRIGFTFQSEAIVRTEVSRAYSNAQQLASEQISETIPELRKRWLTGLRKRRGHIEVENKYDIGGEIGPIPIKDRFEVKDFSRTGRSDFFTGKRNGQRVYKRKGGFTRRGSIITDRMLFPRDSSASVGNIVNCSCTILDVIPDLEESINKALGIL